MKRPSDLSVFDYGKEDDVPESSKFYNPKFHDVDARTKYDFLQHASSGSITQMNESHTVERIDVVSIDDDDCGLVNDDMGAPQIASIEAASKESKVFGGISDRMLQQNCHFNGDRVKHKSSSLEMEINFTCSSGQSPGNSHMNHISPPIPESPYSTGSVDSAGASDGCDGIQESFPSTSPEQEETTFPFDGLAQDGSFSGFDMEKMDIALLTDYVYYGEKLFPACLIVFSNTSLVIETENSDRFEWNVEDIHGIESQWFGRAFTAKVKVRVLTKDAVPVKNEQEGITGFEELEFLVHDPHWLQRQEWIISLDVRYRAIWRIWMNGKACEGGPLSFEDNHSSRHYIPKFDEPFGEVVYPKGDKDAVSISKTDVDLLKPELFLNDTIIDFYLKYLENEIPSSERGRFYFFNSFFFTKLADPNNNTSGDFDGKAGFQRTRKWTRKVNIFEKDYIFIPVNYKLHWSLIVICHPGEVAKFNEENADESVKVPCVLHMDSIRGSHAGLKDLVQSYLLEEWKEKQKETSEDIISKFLNLRFLSLELPQQNNSSDCGLFLLHYAELFIAEAPENFSPFQINNFDNFLKPDWFVPGEASLKRAYIQRLIYDLEDCPLENNSPSNLKSKPTVLLENHENDNFIEVLSGRTSHGKAWNPLHPQTVHGMDISLLDMTLCSNVSGLGMRDLLECQHFGQGASFGQPGCPVPPITEEVHVDPLTPSALGQTKLNSRDEMAAGSCHLGYIPGDFNQGFHWNTEFSDQGIHPEDNSPPSSNYSCEDSEEVVIMEHEPEVEGCSSGEKRSSDQQRENLDSLTESYASASSDMMETLAEDSQPSQDGHNALENLYTPSSEQAKEEMSAHQEFKVIEDDEAIATDNEVVEDSSPDLDEGQPAKRIRLTPSGDGVGELIRSLSKEVQV